MSLYSRDLILCTTRSSRRPTVKGDIATTGCIARDHRQSDTCITSGCGGTFFANAYSKCRHQYLLQTLACIHYTLNTSVTLRPCSQMPRKTIICDTGLNKYDNSVAVAGPNNEQPSTDSRIILLVVIPRYFHSGFAELHVKGTRLGYLLLFWWVHCGRFYT